MEDLIKKHAKNFALFGGEREVLEGIHYREDGSVVITDGTALLHVKNCHGYKEPITKHYNTGKTINEDYPNLSSVLNKWYPNHFTLKLPEIVRHLEALKVSVLISNVGVLKDDLTFKVVDVIHQSYVLTLKGEISDNFKPVLLKVINLYKCLSVFKDLKVDIVRVRLGDPLSPVSFSNEAETVEVLISPVRRH